MTDLHRLLTILVALGTAATLAALPACRGTGDDDDDTADDDDTVDDDDDTTDDDDVTDDDDDYRHELTVTDPVVGDFSCLGEQSDPPEPGADSASIFAYVRDFSEDDPIAGAKALLWTNNDPADEGAADFSFDTGTDHTGAITVDDGLVKSCQPFAYKVWTEWTPPETMPTYQMGNVLAPVGDPEWNDFEMISVSYATYQIIPLSLAIQPDEAKGIAAGRFYDCAGEAVEGGQVLVKDDQDNLAEDVYIRYFVDELPDRDQPWTSEDGIFGAIDVPPGQWAMELWGVLDTDMPECPTEEVNGRCMLAKATVFVIPNSVNIANAEMKLYPDSCYTD
jgi:hypothetical protein